MAAIRPKLSGLAAGSILPSWDALEAVIEDCSITRKIAFFCCPKDQTRANYICRQKYEGCAFRVYASLNQRARSKILYRPLLRCPSQQQIGTRSWLQRILPDLVYVSMRTIPQDIIDTVRKHVSHIKLCSAAYLPIVMALFVCYLVFIVPLHAARRVVAAVVGFSK